LSSSALTATTESEETSSVIFFERSKLSSLSALFVKNHDFTPKNHIFPILGGAREIFGVFHVKNHDFTPKKNHIFTNFRGAL
jgi:hypothetical protein